jgi:hypothetical protein
LHTSSRASGAWACPSFSASPSAHNNGCSSKVVKFPKYIPNLQNYFIFFITNISSSISHLKTLGFHDTAILAFFLSSIFVYEPILIKKIMNANIIKM